MGIAGEAFKIAPRSATAIAADVDDLHGNVDKPIRLNRPEQRACRTVEAATTRRAGDNLDLALGTPRHRMAAGLVEPRTLAQRSTSLRMKSANHAGARSCGGATSYPRSANRLTTIGSSRATESA